MRGMVQSGESFARFRMTTDAAAIPFHLELLDRELVPTDLQREIGGGRGSARASSSMPPVAGSPPGSCPHARAIRWGFSTWTAVMSGDRDTGPN